MSSEGCSGVLREMRLDEGSHLQDKDEVVDRLVAVKEVVLGQLLVLVIIFELLDDVRMLQEPQQDLLRHLSWTKGLHLYRRRGEKEFGERTIESEIVG